MAQGLTIPKPSGVVEQVYHGHMGVTMISSKISHDGDPVYHLPTDRVTGLLSLLIYARAHRHCRLWIGAILTILAREGSLHG
jgi:hypothetical protein